MIFNEILFSFIETVSAVELEIDFQIAETNFERFEIVQKTLVKLKNVKVILFNFQILKKLKNMF